MAKAKPKKAAKPKPKPKSKPKPIAKPKPKPKAMATRGAMAMAAPLPPVTKPVIIKGILAVSRSYFAIESAVGFPGNCTVSTTITDKGIPSATWTLAGSKITGTLKTILCIGIDSTSSSGAVGVSGTLVVGLTNPPSDLGPQVPVPVDYIDDYMP